MGDNKLWLYLCWCLSSYIWVIGATITAISTELESLKFKILDYSPSKRPIFRSHYKSVHNYLSALKLRKGAKLTLCICKAFGYITPFWIIGILWMQELPQSQWVYILLQLEISKEYTRNFKSLWRKRWLSGYFGFGFQEWILICCDSLSLYNE